MKFRTSNSTMEQCFCSSSSGPQFACLFVLLVLCYFVDQHCVCHDEDS